MNVVLVMLAGIGVAYLGRPGEGRRPFTAADLCAGIVGGLVGLSIAGYYHLGAGAWELGLPMLVASALALGLQSIHKRDEG